MERHERYFDHEREGWFLHLHGSPLFVTRDGEPRKITSASLSEYAGENSFHIVLTNADSKPSVIENSSILRVYWKKLDELLGDAARITVFGYGGGDRHLNRLIGLNNTAELRIVSRTGGDPEPEVSAKWRRKLGAVENQAVKVVLVENLMHFTEWR